MSVFFSSITFLKFDNIVACIGSLFCSFLNSQITFDMGRETPETVKEKCENTRHNGPQNGFSGPVESASASMGICQKYTFFGPTPNL